MPDERGTPFQTPAEIVAAGEAIYAEKHKAHMEAEHAGEFVAIDVLTGEAYLGHFPEQALDEAQAQAPDGIFHLIKVGSPGAFRIGRVLLRAQGLHDIHP